MKIRSLYLFYYWGSALAWATVLYFLSNQPDLTVVSDQGLDAILRKFAHLISYAFLTFLIYRAWLWTFRTKLREFEIRKDFDASILIESLLLVIAILMTVLYGAFDEYHQTMVASRSGEITDVLIDSLGSVLAGIAVIRFGILNEIEHRFAKKGWKILTGQKYYGE